MNHYSLAIAWNWEYDLDFIGLIENECQQRGMSVLNLRPANLQEMMPEINEGRITFRALYDRASDDDEAFLELIDSLKHKEVVVINPHAHLERAKDKATMHLELITAGLEVPYTIIVSPYNKHPQIELDHAQVEKLGKPFIIKPANTTGGGIGVVLRAESLKDIIEARQQHKNDKYLLQEHVHPVILEHKRAWFRSFYAFGEIINCWWDDLTHFYHPCAAEDERQFGLSVLREMMHKIQAKCMLDFFSSEIALTASGKYIVIDYVNEICDMRLQSRFVDGVPDAVVRKIAALLVERVSSFTSHAGK